MELGWWQRVLEALEGSFPAWLLQDRIAQEANLPFLWMMRVLRFDEACKPDQILGRWAYDTWAQAMEEGVLDPCDAVNEGFIRARVQRAFVPPYEHLPATQRFLRTVEVKCGDLSRWGAHDAFGGVSDELDELHYHVVLKHPNSLRLHFLATVERLSSEWRLISYAPQDNPTWEAFAQAGWQIAKRYPSVRYVQRVRNLTVFSPLEEQTSPESFPTMQSEFQSSVGSEAVPEDQESVFPRSASHPAEADLLGRAYEWRAGEPFHPGPITEVLGQRPPNELEHPITGPGLAWDLPTGSDECTRLELFPEQRVVKLRFVDTVNEPQRREYVVERLAIHRAERGESVVVFSLGNRRASVVRIYPSGEFDEHIRVVPVGADALPSSGTIWRSEAPRPSPPSRDGTPHELTAAEAAQRLGVTPSAVARLAKSGRLRGRQVAHRKWVIDAQSVADYHRRKPGPKPNSLSPVVSDPSPDPVRR